MDVKRELDRGLDLFGDVVRLVGPHQWDAATPCAEWNVRQLTGHVVDVMHMTVDVLRGGQLHPLSGATESADPLSAWEEAAAGVRGALEGADVDAVRETPMGARPVSFSLTFPAVDLYVHAWDVGTAIGRAVHLPEDAVSWIDGFLRRMPPDRLRGPRAFGPERPAPADADPTTALMAFLGRAV